MPQCKGISKNGDRCKNITKAGQEYCRLHHKKNFINNLTDEFKSRYKTKYAVIATLILLIIGWVVGLGSDYLKSNVACYWNEITNHPIEAFILGRTYESNNNEYLIINIKNNLCSPINDPYAELKTSCDFYFGPQENISELYTPQSTIPKEGYGAFILRNPDLTEGFLPRNETCYEAYSIAVLFEKIDDNCSIVKETYALLYDSYNHKTEFLNTTNQNYTKKICSHCFYNVTLYSNDNNYYDNSNKQIPLTSMTVKFHSVSGERLLNHLNSYRELFYVSVVPQNRKCDNRDCNIFFFQEIKEKLNFTHFEEPSSELLPTKSFNMSLPFPPCSY